MAGFRDAVSARHLGRNSHPWHADVVTSTSPRAAGLALVALLAVLALSGCLRFTSDLTVSPENTVSGEYVIAVAEGSGKPLGLSDRELAEELWKDSGLGAGLTAPSIGGYRSGGYAGMVVRFTDEPLAAFAPTATHFGISRLGDEFIVSGTLSGGTVREGADAAAPPDVRVTLTFPGPVLDSNGQVAGRTVTWTITEDNAALTARASAIPVTDNSITLAYFVAGVLALAAVAYWLAGVIGRWRYPQYQRG